MEEGKLICEVGSDVLDFVLLNSTSACTSGAAVGRISVQSSAQKGACSPAQTEPRLILDA